MKKLIDSKTVTTRLFLLLLMINLLSGCSTASQAPAVEAATKDTITLDIVLNDSYYGFSDSNMVTPLVWTLPTNQDVVINFENRGNLAHNWAVIQPGIEVPFPFQKEVDGDLILYDLGVINSGAQSTVVLQAPSPGEYQVICTVTGHYPFMQGRLVVTDR